MKLEYHLTVNDLLNYYMYVWGTSETLRKKRKRNRFIWPVVYVAIVAIYFFIFFILGINIYDLGSFLYGAVFLLISIGWILLHPTLTKRLSKRRILDQITKSNIPPSDREITFVVTDDNIEKSTTDSDVRFAYSAVVNMVELRDYFLVGLNTGGSFILPKGRTKGDDLSIVVKTIAEHAKVEILDARDWKWK